MKYQIPGKVPPFYLLGLRSMPDTWVTVCTGDRGCTIFGANGYSKGSTFLVSKSKKPKVHTCLSGSTVIFSSRD